ncbi:MAG TPA: Coenzyme F420 hydrogenase/dehydrogenase, beta subunit C-terminal domain [Thermodesulfobacteriota bacterium]|nr:Coenzyme F420 hydrogenase/dehydrogenase, beta subunit C-terminal domain [Thermodesulfobacteriota bacterium]
MSEAVTVEFNKTFNRMMNEVVALGSCCGCSMCVVTCPYGVIKYDHQSMFPYVAKPKGDFDYCPISEEVGCDVCANACERLGPEQMKPIKPEEIDVHVFGRARREDEYYGVTRFICAARSTNPSVVANAEDGGAVTEILKCAFEDGIIDGAAVAAPSDKMWLEPAPRVVKSVDELMQTAKSWYTYCATPLALKEAVDKHKLSKLALVGVSCEVSGYGTTVGADSSFIAAERGEKNVERQNKHLKQYVDAVQFTIGLLCTETFVFDGFIHEYLQEKVGINPQDVVKVNVKGKVVTDIKDGTRIETPLLEARVYQRHQCNYCGDFSAEHSDISAGGVGSDGWTILIVRSERGERIFKRTIEKGYLEVRPASEFERSMKVLKRLTETQRKRADEQYISIGSLRR